MYENLRIEVLISDCCYTAHLGYAYICGECRQMKITSSGCPKGLSTDVTTLMAPRNMTNYVWYACDYGMLESSELDNPAYTWHQLTEDVSATNYNYNVQAEDFRVTRALNEAGVPIIVDDTSNWQSFRCKMTSALDPAKPFDSYLYANVQNTKPPMKVDSLLDCRGGITLWNKSFVPGAPQLVLPDSTVWSFYNNVACGGDPIAVFRGDSVYMNFDTNGIQGLLVRTNTQQTGDEECYSEAKYPIQPRFRPKAAMTADPTVLCDADETTMVDITPGEVRRRVWRFRAANADPDDMTLSDSVVGYGDVNRSYSRSFSHAVEPIELLVDDGTFFLDFFHANDTVWCDTVVHDTVSVFLHPELEVTGDTMVCEGSTTDATVRALGVEGCTYEWSLTLGTVTGGLPSGPRLQVVPYADKATYYVKVTSPQGCVAWDSIHAYMVKPRLSMMPDDGRICPGGTATLTGSDAHHYTWTASPADASLAGQDSNDVIRVSPKVTTTYTMVGHGANNCDATPLKKTVKIVPLPVPTVKLTPGFIDTDNPQLVLRDVSPYSVATSWLFNDGTTATGKEVSHTFDNCIGYDSVSVTMTSFNELNCPIDHPFAIPVKVFNAWFPNAFTPGSNDANDHFSLFTLNAYEYFHIYIYNRRGELVYESADPKFKWDGTRDGEPLPQGAYVYTCRFRKPGTPTLGQMKGTVTIIR
jgi:gliding motility-associated-like protein